MIDPADPTRGLVFDGRIAEDFKLNTGTWVSVGPLRANLLTALAPLILDVVIAGLNREFIALLILPDMRACAGALQIDDVSDPVALIGDERLRVQIQQRLAAHNKAHAASSTCVRRVTLLAEPASLDHGEITDKGSINQRAVLQRRAVFVEAMYQADAPSNVLIVQ